MAEKTAPAKNPAKSQVARKSESRGLTDDQRAEIREVFESVYMTNRRKLFATNFWRGVFFGLGTFLGGTIVVAIIVWILAQTVDIFPWARDFTQNLIDSLRK